MVASMRLLPIPDADGNPMIWINADHLVSVQPITHRGQTGIVLAAEVKVDGMPLQRIPLGELADAREVQEAFANFLAAMQAAD